MQANVGIIRKEDELVEALEKLDALRERVKNVSAAGGPVYNPGWNLATDLPAMITVSISAAQGALNRRESRGGQTREDFPKADPALGKINFVQRQTQGAGYLNPISVTPEPLAEMPDELKALFEEAK